MIRTLLLRTRVILHFVFLVVTITLVAEQARRKQIFIGPAAH